MRDRLTYWLEKQPLRDRLADWLAWHLPSRVVYHCCIRAWAHATTPPYGATMAPEVTTSEVVSRWARGHGMEGHGE